MTITPVEIRHVELKRGIGGYRRSATDALLEDIVASYEATWRERAELADAVERLETELARFRELERLLRDTMMSAERAADTLRADAAREYELLLQEARSKARELVEQAEAERERIRADARRLAGARDAIVADLRAALPRLEGGGATAPSHPGAGDLAETGELALPGQAA
jgi:cell division initiation protein